MALIAGSVSSGWRAQDHFNPVRDLADRLRLPGAWLLRVHLVQDGSDLGQKIDGGVPDRFNDSLFGWGRTQPAWDPDLCQHRSAQSLIGHGAMFP
jgi:hypothetical protein